MRRLTLSDSITRPGNTTPYTAGDVISEVTTDDHYTFTSGKAGQFRGKIDTARMMINANQGTKPDLELWLFLQDIAEVADNGAFAPTDSEILTLIDVIKFPVANWLEGLSGSGADGNIVQTVRDLNIPIPESSGDLYGQLVVRNAYTPIDSEQFDCHLLITLD